jgi:hypothetical protein
MTLGADGATHEVPAEAASETGELEEPTAS